MADSKSNVQKEQEEYQSDNSSTTTLSDSDLEEVLVESWEFVGETIVKVDPGFFSSETETTGFSKKEPEPVYDSTPPHRNQIVGATPEYIESLRAAPDKIEELVPELTLEQLYQPSNMYWNYPRAIKDYSEIEEKMVPILPNGGVKKLICKEGREGEQLRVGHHVHLNYYVYVEGYESCVNSNKAKSKPYSLVLGRKKGIIPVMELGALTMKVKEVAAFLATPEYGYGRLGMGEWIPENKRVLCIIEVLSKLSSPSESSSIINMVPSERKLLGFEEVYSFASERKAEGNKNLSSNKNARALRKYLQAASYLQDAIPKDTEQEMEKIELLHSLYTNICVASFRTNQLSTVVQFSKKAIQLPVPEKNKALDYFRCARALYLEKKPEEAKLFIDKANNFLDANPEVIELKNYIYTVLEMRKNGDTDDAATSSGKDDAKPKRKKRNSICDSLLLGGRRGLSI